MKKLNLFKKIFTRNLHSGKTPLSKLADDVGSLHGVFSFVGRDINTGEIVSHGEYNNMIVNQSKSAIIRLLGQEDSIYKGTIDPTDFKITKMRFSNDMGTGESGIANPNKLEYYDIAEASHRISYSSEVSSVKFGGGIKGQETCSPPIDPVETEYQHDFSNSFDNAAGATGYQAVTNGKVFDLRSGERPPSHGSVTIKIYKDFDDGNGEQLIEEIDFIGASGSELIYNRGAFSNYPYRIKNYKIGIGTKYFYHVSSPIADGVVFTLEDAGMTRVTMIQSSGLNTTNTRIFYDYTVASPGWKFLLEGTQTEIGDLNPALYPDTRISAGDNPTSGNYIWDLIKLEFTIGQYSVINLIIPKYGQNNGYGTSDLIRYNNQNGDYYNTVTPVYQDCGSDFIDDYAVTFTTSMNSDQGNGVGGSGTDLLRYTKAYLFCKNDDMFSSILFPTTDFEKNANNSYQISWKILAPVE